MSTSDQAEPMPAPNGKKAAANRANAQKSTGPRTAAGKAASSMNALRHGLYSDQVVLPLLEKKSDWDALLAGLTRDQAPVGELESILVERIASALWRVRRAARQQHNLVRACIERAAEKLEGAPLLTPEGAEGEEPEVDPVMLERFAGHSLTPDPATLTALSQHETSLDKSVFKNIHELQRQQQARQGRRKGGKKQGTAPGAHDVY